MCFRSFARLVVLVVLINVARSAIAEGVFDGCKATAVSREGWKAVCASAWLISVTDAPRGTSPTEFTDGIVPGLRAATGGTVHREAAKLSLPGTGWTATSRPASAHGSADSQALQGAQFVFSGDVLTFLGGQRVSFTLDSTKSPLQIDLGRNQEQLGIYELRGDTLKLCVGPSDDRPTEFSTKPRPNHTSFVLRRRR